MVINIYNYKSHQEAIKAVSDIDFKTFHQVKITKKRGKRSIDQNALYWMWLTCIEQETGTDKNDLHLYFRTIYLGTELKTILGNDLSDVKSTTVLDTAQFTQYLDKIQVFANTELAIKLPNPDDLQFEQFKDYYSKFL